MRKSCDKVVKYTANQAMYQMPMGALIQTFPINKHIKLVCSLEPDPGPSGRANRTN